jgi:hypothetical protein
MNNIKIIGLTGWIGAGKDTVADYLTQKYGYQRASWAGTLKDAVSNIFGWDREMLEGITSEQRAQREVIDAWWAERLNIPELSPRWVLQQWGTEVGRKSFHNDIWIASLENKLRNSQHNIVISDCRFPNEINSIKNLGGEVWWVMRGELPEWFNTAYRQNTTSWDAQWLLEDTHQLMEQVYTQVHSSEWAWVGTKFDAVLENNGTLDDLYKLVDQTLASPA